MKKVVILTQSKREGEVLRDQLQKVLGSFLDFVAYSLEGGETGKIICDLCLMPVEDISNEISHKLLPETKIIPLRRTFPRDKIDRLLAQPYGTKVLVAHPSMDYAKQTVTSLLELGVNHLDYILYDAGAREVPEDVTVAILPREGTDLPRHIRHRIDLGDPIVDVYSLFNVVSSANILNRETKKIINNYIQENLPQNAWIYDLISGIEYDRNFIDEAFNTMECVALASDKNNRIIYHNRPDKYIASEKLIGQSLEGFLGGAYAEPDSVDSKVVEIKEHLFVVNKKSIRIGGNYIGCILLFRDLSALQELLVACSRTKEFSLQRAKYTFDDIFGRSEAILRVVNLAKKAAPTDLDILIEGESGTGKELFASAIHNASSRREGPFIAFNCAALSNNLLESELFGYEEGAFTGAKKGGKHGLLEAANGGTVFLDEIGEMSKEIQVKFLRTLQEREVIRVGGINRIPINIRVIAATNQDMNKLVENGVFRVDLFYRLNALYLKIPPLRERREDYMYLINAIVRNKNAHYKIPQDLLRVLESYSWPGNVRELKNYCEYIIDMDEGFSIETLPANIKANLRNEQRKPAEHADELGSQQQAEKLMLLELMYELNMKGIKTGRKTLSDAVCERNLPLSEQEVRSLLRDLSGRGFVEIRKGRSGSRITESGIRLLGRSAG